VQAGQKVTLVPTADATELTLQTTA